ncbi:hypothetical protein KCTCHS21_00150 [Cohnella abietis]|uniref:Uncharacterized protein n=1 Tax=Cohnella abietis TaxID=2507935 RepID=A0A3T1CXQ5_9BACL|nr:hypothetical protein KCTCHS21_00150 [Cohnella abietis]
MFFILLTAWRGAWGPISDVFHRFRGGCYSNNYCGGVSTMFSFYFLLSGQFGVGIAMINIASEGYVTQITAVVS